MHTTVTLDDHLLERATELTKINAPTALLHSALTGTIERESVRHLALLAGAALTASAPRRKRRPAADA